MYQEDVLFLAMMGAGVVVSLVMSGLVNRKSPSFLQAFLRSALISFVLFGIAALWWFITASDGFAQVIGAAYYGAAFVAIQFLQAGLLYILRKLHKKP